MKNLDGLVFLDKNSYRSLFDVNPVSCISKIFLAFDVMLFMSGSQLMSCEIVIPRYIAVVTDSSK